MCDQQSLRSACAYAQSDQSLCLSLEYSMSAKLLTEHQLEFLSLKGDCTGLSECTLVKMPHCWKSHVAALFYYLILNMKLAECTLRCANKFRIERKELTSENLFLCIPNPISHRKSAISYICAKLALLIPTSVLST